MPDLLLNGDFEMGFHAWRGTPELEVAAGWTPWWVEQTGDDPAWKNRRPEFRRAPLGVDPGRVRVGESAQQYGSFWGTHIAGLWQQVVVPPGARLCFRAWGHAWSSEGDRPRPSQNPTCVHMSIGIDPLGGTDPMSSCIIWAKEQNAIDDWCLLSVETQANTDVITLFLRSAPEWPKKHQDIFWDEASLEMVDEGLGEETKSGGDRQTRFEINPASPQLGMEMAVRVLSRVGHAYVSLLVRGPELELLPVKGPIAGHQGEEYSWEFCVQPQRVGPHIIIFGSDAGSRVIRWAQLMIGNGLALVEAAAEREIELPVRGAVGRGAPRAQYSRTFVLLPPTADSVWAEAAMRGSFDARRTVGFSADDAGLGDLDDRRVIAVNPHHWLNELTADWFEQHYPGVKFFALIVDSPDELARALHNWRD